MPREQPPTFGWNDVNNEKVLVVDDDHFNCTLMKETCESIGFSVIQAHNGIEAVELAIAERPDLVLLDIMMCGKDGFEVCGELRGRAETAETPIIVVTALQDADSKVRGLKLGADDFVTKPFHVLELQTRIRRVIDARHFRRQLSQDGAARSPSDNASRLHGVRVYQQLREDLDYEFERARRYQHPLSLTLLAIDGLDRLPEQSLVESIELAGSLVLGVLRRNLRAVDLLYRIQEDQFILLLPETARSSTKSALQRLREKLKTASPDPARPLTFSAALASWPHFRIKTGHDILQAASDLMKESHSDAGSRLLDFTEPDPAQH